jgi:hypothetical protein
VLDDGEIVVLHVGAPPVDLEPRAAVVDPSTQPSSGETSPDQPSSHMFADRTSGCSEPPGSVGAGIMTVMTEQADRDRVEYRRAMDWLSYAVHELPAGVLYGANGADARQCAEMVNGLNDVERLCTRLGLDGHHAFFDACRWHFEHYPHYLGRRRHFVDYESYTRDRSGPVRVPKPPAPPRWLR